MNNDFVPGFDDDRDDSLKITLDSLDGIQSGLLVN